MNRIKKSIKSVLALVAVCISSLSIAQEEVVEAASAAAPVVQDTPIYAQLGVSSTTLFIIMTVFTLLLLSVVWSVASSTKNILKYKQDEVKKKSSSGVKTFLTIITLTFSANLMAANSEPATSLIPFPDSVFWAYIVVDAILIMILFYFAGIIKGSISDMVVLRGLFRWKKIGKTLTNAVPIEQEDSILLDHDYDGITELDNDLPPWWKYGFYLTIAWAFVYFFYYQVLEIGNLQEAEYLAEMAEGERQVAEYKAAHPEMINADNVTLLTDAASISQGKSIYNSKCVSCHMEGGRGGVGPNLTDDYWLYGNDISGVFTTISEGANNGMAAWKSLLPANEIQAVASYILQLEYIGEPEGREPQGEKK